MRELVHPNLVNYREIFMERNNLMMVMELMKVTSSNSTAAPRGFIFIFRAVH